MTTTIRSEPARRGFRRPRAAGVLLAAALLAGLTYAAGAVRPAVPSEPPVGAGAAIGISGAGGAGGVTFSPGSIAQIDRSIAVWAANLAAEPRDFLSATTLASLYHARGRLSGDLGDQERALEAATTAERIAPTEPGARAVEASIRFTLHDFARALSVAETLYRDDPAQLGALALVADSKLELGHVAEARIDYARLAAATSGPAVDVRLARLASVTGDADGALGLARAARDATRKAAAAGETVDLGFYEFAAGEYARLAGDAVAARAGYLAALAARSTDLGALVGLARIDAFEGRPAEAISGLRAAAAIAPQPETLALLGDLLAGGGDTSGAARQFDTVRFVERLGEVQSIVFDRVLIRFELDHDGASETVLTKARASLAARPDSTGHDAVAWSLYRLGRFEQAAAAIAAARAEGADDARLAFHAGAIALARGDATAGRRDLERAMSFGPALDPIERAEAERLLRR